MELVSVSGDIRVGSTWRRRQNPVSETSWLKLKTWQWIVSKIMIVIWIHLPQSRIERQFGSFWWMLGLHWNLTERLWVSQLILFSVSINHILLKQEALSVNVWKREKVTEEEKNNTIWSNRRISVRISRRKIYTIINKGRNRIRLCSRWLQAGCLKVEVRVPVRDIFLFLPDRLCSHKVSCPMGTWSPSSTVKRPGREADHSPATNTEVKKTRIYISTPPHVFIS
jgi:hypothetical protein